MLYTWQFIYSHKEWESNYNCSIKSYDEWNSEGTADVPIGLLYLCVGIISEIVYIPVIIAMSSTKFLQHSCYKLMFFLSILDMIELSSISLITGTQCMLGIHFCNSPILFYLAGFLGIGIWYAASVTCIVLAVNRCLEVCWPWGSNFIFGGKRIYIWFIFPFLYSVILSLCFFPPLFNITYHVWIFDPFIGNPALQNDFKFKNNITFHTIHNLMVAALLGICYSVLIIGFIVKTKKLGGSQTISKFQIIMTLQAVLICIEISFAASIYVIIQYFSIPYFIMISTHVMWMLVHGDTPIVYLVLNKSLRNAVLDMFNLRRRFSTSVGEIRQVPSREHNPSTTYQHTRV